VIEAEVKKEIRLYLSGAIALHDPDVFKLYFKAKKILAERAKHDPYYNGAKNEIITDHP